MRPLIKLSLMQSQTVLLKVSNLLLHLVLQMLMLLYAVSTVHLRIQILSSSQLLLLVILLDSALTSLCCKTSLFSVDLLLFFSRKQFQANCNLAQVF